MLLYCALVFTLSILYVMPSTISELEGKIKGGMYVKDDKRYPFMVIVVVDANWSSKGIIEGTQCGGSYIYENWILTAAHCLVESETLPLKIAKREKIILFMGIIDKAELKTKAQSRVPDSLFVHEKFHPVDFGCDIALMKITKPFQITNMVKLATIPSGPPKYVGTYWTIIGYGADSAKLRNKKLKMAIAKPWSHKKCEPQVYSVPNWEKLELLCFGSPEGVGCVGDSGGPLFYEHAGKAIIIGITSFGYEDNCAAADMVVYENVWSHRYWLRKVISAESISERSGQSKHLIVLVNKFFVFILFLM